MSGTAFTCPKCGASARSAREIAAGALVKCPRCSHVFRFGEEAVATVEPVRPADLEPRRQRFDDDDDRPRRPRDDDYDDRPRRRRYDDDDDRPRRRKSTGTGLVFGIVFFIMLIGVAIGVVAYMYKNSNNNEVVMRPGSPPPGAPPGLGPNNFLGEQGFGEQFDISALNNPGEDGPGDKERLTRSAANLLSDSSLTADRPRRLVGPPPATAKSTVKGDVAAASLPRDVLTRVKNATTFILCRFNDGRAGSGSGFFVGRDLVMTNAHVVGMLPPGSKKPQALDVILNSGL